MPGSFSFLEIQLGRSLLTPVAKEWQGSSSCYLVFRFDNCWRFSGLAEWSVVLINGSACFLCFSSCSKFIKPRNLSEIFVSAQTQFVPSRLPTMALDVAEKLWHKSAVDIMLLLA